MRPSQKVGKIFSKTQCQILTVQTCGKLFKALTVPLMLTLLTKLCPTTVELLLISNRKLTYSLTTMPGSANSTCHNPTVTSTASSRNIFMQSAIKRMKGKGAAGSDNFPPSFLKSLGPLALQELLSIFNSSFSLAHCPRIWRVATIIPLLKAGKSPSEVTSFCPISLTSCVVKLLERILADCLYYIAETNNVFSRFQAGFHKGRSCEDQITRIVQAIEDGSQQRPMKSSVLTFLDFSKAYDTV